MYVRCMYDIRTRDGGESMIDGGLSRVGVRRTVRGEMIAGKYVRTRVLFASLTRHTLRLWALTRPSAQPTVPCHGKMAC